MFLLSKLGIKMGGLPLFFQVFGLSCSLMFVIAIYAFITDLFTEGRIFLYTGLSGFLLFFIVILSISNRDIRETGFSQLFSLILSFLLLPLFLAIPPWIILQNVAMIDIYLDNVSAVTTTGLPIFENEFLTRPIHLWRALVAWFGGGLIWVAAFVILLPANSGGFEMLSNKKGSSNAIRNLTLDERSMTLNKVGRKLLPIYVALTVMLWAMLTSLGTDGFTSLIRALSVMSTSGITGPQKFDSDGAGLFGELIIILFLFFALSHNAINFFSHKSRFQKISEDTEIRLGLILILSVTALLTFNKLTNLDFYSNFSVTFTSIAKIVWGNFFTIFSFITTTGYFSSYWNFSSSSDNSLIILILIGLCLFGGGIATTAGGIKLLRISILFSAFSNETGKQLYPSLIAEKKVPASNFQLSLFMAWILFMLFIVSLAVLTIILAMFEMFFEDALLVAVACLTTTGPIVQIIGIEKHFFVDLQFFSKIALILGMVLGRLEILVALSLITFSFRRV